MNEQELRLLFDQQKQRQSTFSSSCPDDEQIAHLAESQSLGEDLNVLKAHVADCPHCAARVADAIRFQETVRERSSTGFRNIAAAAAVAFVAVAIFWLQPQDGINPEENNEVRNISHSQAVPSLIFPSEGQTVTSTDMTVRWTPVADAMHYSVRIVDDYGRIIVDSFADTPEYAVPPHARLAPGVTYYVKIDAYVLGDKSVSSNHIYFTIAN